MSILNVTLDMCVKNSNLVELNFIGKISSFVYHCCFKKYYETYNLHLFRFYLNFSVQFYLVYKKI